jgi:hypothetical protein
MTGSIRQHLITPAAGKRLIAKGLVKHTAIQTALNSGTVAIVAGTTNGYFAEELLQNIGQAQGFSRKHFFRGITLPPGKEILETGRSITANEFPGDVIIAKGSWQKGQTLFDVVDQLQAGDIILKGANAVDLVSGEVAVYVTHPKAGTIGAAIQAVIGRRVRLVVPIGLEKRVYGNLYELAQKLNGVNAHGPRLFPVPGEAFTEIEAISWLTGAKAELVAAGGVDGAEGAVWLAVSGSNEQVQKTGELIKTISSEPAFVCPTTS